MTDRDQSGVARARRRVLRVARLLALEAEAERHNDGFYSEMCRAVACLVSAIDGTDSDRRAVWDYARGKARGDV